MPPVQVTSSPCVLSTVTAALGLVQLRIGFDKVTVEVKEPTSGPPEPVKVKVPPEGESFGIEVPFDVRAIFGKARPPIIITIAGYSFPSTVMVQGGKSYVGVRKSHREADRSRSPDRKLWV